MVLRKTVKDTSKDRPGLLTIVSLGGRYPGCITQMGFKKICDQASECFSAKRVQTRAANNIFKLFTAACSLYYFASFEIFMEMLYLILIIF